MNDTPQEEQREALRDETLLQADETLHDLQRGGLRILQKKAGFRFGTDAVLLADFTHARTGERIADFGTGTGILPLLIGARSVRTRFEAIEIQPDVADMARRSVRLNKLEERIAVHCADVRDAHMLLGYESVDRVVCNPPYTPVGGGMQSPIQTRARSRHEQVCSLGEMMASAGRVVKNGGRLDVVFPCPRMLELMDAMRDAHLEPKRIRLVCARAQDAPKLVLMEAIKNARPMLHVEPMLILYEADGRQTEELERIYGLSEPL